MAKYSGGGESKRPRAGNPMPAKEDLAENEVAINATGDLDDLGRCQISAYWLDGYLPPSGVRGQVFFTNLAEFVRRQTADGRKVTALDERTHRLLDGPEITP